MSNLKLGDEIETHVSHPHKQVLRVRLLTSEAVEYATWLVVIGRWKKVKGSQAGRECPKDES